eukprot:TRINITY_DN3635_c0_g1_i1.p1 TRINITY_DN3635_c0_g1~~TRINITY_DN3635_c0_g1_i1.p1  ORF type:complete len:107 (-),score=24.48 TRINITY_DN3635_c0_g1_i1:32-352(-)
MSQTPKFNSDEIYRVRRNSRLNQGLFLSKLIIKKHGKVQIEGMGECISLAFKFAQILSKNGYATIEKIHEECVEEKERRGLNPKIAITLKKSAKFDEMTKDIVLKE